MPGAHPQGLAAASPVEQVVARDHADEAGAVEIHPSARGFALQRLGMVQEDGAGSEYHEESRQQHTVVHQRGDPPTEPGAGHDVGVDDCFLDAAGCLAEPPAAVVAGAVFGAGAPCWSRDCFRGGATGPYVAPTASQARALGLASISRSLTPVTRLPPLWPVHPR